MGNNSRGRNSGPRSWSPEWYMRGQESEKWTKDCFYTDTLEFNEAMDRDGVLAPEPVVAAPRPPKGSPGKCMICLGDAAVLDVAHCGHIACAPCLTEYYTQRDLAIYPCRCFACPKRVGIAELARLEILSAADAERAHKFNQLAKFRDNMHKYTTMTCRKCSTVNKTRKDTHLHKLRCRGCKDFIDTTITLAVCPYCRHHTTVKKGTTKNLRCQSCLGVFDHSGGELGAKVSKEDLAMLSKSLADSAYGFGVCPRCGAGVLKNGGCHHMSCVCGAHFEWTSHTVSADAELASARRAQTDPQLPGEDALQRVLDDEVALLTGGGLDT